MALGTAVDIYQQLFDKRRGELATYGGEEDEKLVLKLLKCFSVNLNGRKLLNTDHTKVLLFLKKIVNGKPRIYIY